MNEIIVGVDDTETSRRAALRAAKIAEDLDETLHLVMAVKGGVSKAVNVGGEQYRIDWVTEATQFLESLRTELPIPKATYALGGKDPAKSLCDEAERLQASMIVVGNRRMQGASRVLGAIATDVARHAPCDVLIVKTND